MNHFLFVFALVLSLLGLSRATPAAHNEAELFSPAVVARQAKDEVKQCTRATTVLTRCAASPAERIECMCKTNVYNIIYQCFVAQGRVDKQTDYSAAQRQLDDLTLTCDAAGEKLPLRTLPGEDPERVVGTLNPSATTARPTKDDEDDKTTTTRSSTTTVASTVPSSVRADPVNSKPSSAVAANNAAPTPTLDEDDYALEENDLDSGAAATGVSFAVAISAAMLVAHLAF